MNFDSFGRALISSLVNQPADVKALAAVGWAELNVGWPYFDDQLHGYGKWSAAGNGRGPYIPGGHVVCIAPIPTAAELADPGTKEKPNPLNRVVRDKEGKVVPPPGYRLNGDSEPLDHIGIYATSEGTWMKVVRANYGAVGPEDSFFRPISPSLPPFARVEKKAKDSPLGKSLVDHHNEMLANATNPDCQRPCNCSECRATRIKAGILPFIVEAWDIHDIRQYFRDNDIALHGKDGLRRIRARLNALQQQWYPSWVPLSKAPKITPSTSRPAARFKPGDKVVTQSGERITITSLRWDHWSNDNQWVYFCKHDNGEGEWSESSLAPDPTHAPNATKQAPEGFELTDSTTWVKRGKPTIWYYSRDSSCWVLVSNNAPLWNERDIYIIRSAAAPVAPPAAKGCKYDTDGDGNCQHHPNGCPKDSPPAAKFAVGQRVIYALDDNDRIKRGDVGEVVSVVFTTWLQYSVKFNGTVWHSMTDTELAPVASPAPFAMPVFDYDEGQSTEGYTKCGIYEERRMSLSELDGITAAIAARDAEIERLTREIRSVGNSINTVVKQREVVAEQVGLPRDASFDQIVGRVVDREKARARVAELEGTENELRKELDKARRALLGAGWTLAANDAGETAEAWKPPLGKPPDFTSIDATKSDRDAARADVGKLRAALENANIRIEACRDQLMTAVCMKAESDISNRITTIPDPTKEAADVPET